MYRNFLHCACNALLPPLPAEAGLQGPKVSSGRAPSAFVSFIFLWSLSSTTFTIKFCAQSISSPIFPDDGAHSARVFHVRSACRPQLSVGPAMPRGATRRGDECPFDF